MGRERQHHVSWSFFKTLTFPSSALSFCSLFSGSSSSSKLALSFSKVSHSSFLSYISFLSLSGSASLSLFFRWGDSFLRGGTPWGGIGFGVGGGGVQKNHKMGGGGKCVIQPLIQRPWKELQRAAKFYILWTSCERSQESLFPLLCFQLHWNILSLPSIILSTDLCYNLIL